MAEKSYNYKADTCRGTVCIYLMGSGVPFTFTKESGLTFTATPALMSKIRGILSGCPGCEGISFTRVG